jgi:hypothetical protein
MSRRLATVLIRNRRTTSLFNTATTRYSTRKFSTITSRSSSIGAKQNSLSSRRLPILSQRVTFSSNSDVNPTPLEGEMSEIKQITVSR